MEKIGTKKFGTSNVRITVCRDIILEGDNVHIFLDYPISSVVSGKISSSLSQAWHSNKKLPDAFAEVNNFSKKVQEIVPIVGVSAHYDNLLGNYVRLMAKTDKSKVVEELTKLIMSE